MIAYFHLSGRGEVYISPYFRGPCMHQVILLLAFVSIYFSLFFACCMKTDRFLQNKQSDLIGNKILLIEYVSIYIIHIFLKRKLRVINLCQTYFAKFRV
jgi:hypothetical protein